MQDPKKNCYRDGFDSVGWQILFLVVMDLLGKMEIHATLGCEMGVWGPHCSEHLANQPYGIFSGVSMDGIAMGCDGTSVVAVEENLEEGDRVIDLFEKWSEGQFGAEVGPELPVGISSSGA